MGLCINRRFKTFFGSAVIFSLSASVSTQAVDFLTLYLAKMEDAEKACENIKNGKDSVFPYIFTFYQHYKLFIDEWKTAIYFRIVRNKNKAPMIFFYGEDKASAVVQEVVGGKVSPSGCYNIESESYWIIRDILCVLKEKNFIRVCRLISDYTKDSGKKWKELSDSGYFNRCSCQS